MDSSWKTGRRTRNLQDGRIDDKAVILLSGCPVACFCHFVVKEDSASSFKGDVCLNKQNNIKSIEYHSSRVGLEVSIE
jgi:hypothetical protein